MNQAKSPKLDIVIPAFRMHTQTFINLLDGVSEEDALKRIEGQSNHLIWMVGNFVTMRHDLASVLGSEEKPPFHDLFFMGKALDESYTYPTLQTLKDSLKEISPKVFQLLLKVSDTELEEEFKVGMDIPFIAENKLNFIGMCIGREDYLLGQMGLMRRLLGLPGMKYNIDTSVDY